MDIIAAVITAGVLLVLFITTRTNKIFKRLQTALLSGFIVFIILTDRISLIEQKIGIVLVSFLLIFAVNLRIKKQEDDLSGLQENNKTRNS